MSAFLDSIILLSIGCVAGFMNVLAGGGSALTVPIMILMGFDPTVANGTNRLAILVEAGAGVAAFHRERYSDFNTSLRLASYTLPGGLLGAFFAVKIDDRAFTLVLGVVLLFIVASLFLPKPSLSKPHPQPHNLFTAFAMFGIGFYGGFLQAGVGFLIMASLTHLAGLSLIATNMHKVFIVMVFTVPSILIFAWSGNIDWSAGAILALGMGAGAWWAVKLAIHRGERIVRAVLAIALVLLAARLMVVYR